MLSMNRSGSTTGTPSVSSGYTPSLKRRKLDEDSRESVIVSQKAGTPHVPTGISESVLKSSPNLCPNGRTDKGSSAPLLEARGTQHLVANNNNGPVRCVSSDATHSLLEDAGLVAHKEPMEYPSTRSDVPPGLFLLEGNSVSQMENIPSTIVMADKSTTDNMNDLPPQFLKQNMMSPPEKLHIELPSEIQDSQPSQGVDGYLSEASMELDSPIEELRVSVGLQSFTEVVYDAGRTTPDKESEGSARIRSCLSSPYSPPYSPSYDFTPTSPPFYSTVSEIAPQTNVPAVIQLLAPPVPDSVPEQQTNFAPEVPTVMSLFSNLFPTILVSCTNCRAPFTIATLTVRPDGFYIW